MFAAKHWGAICGLMLLTPALRAQGLDTAMRLNEKTAIPIPKTALELGGGRGLDVAQLTHLYDAARPRPQAWIDLGPQPERFAEPKKQAPSAPARGWSRPAAGHPLVVPVPQPSPADRWTFRHLLADTARVDRYDELIVLHARRYQLNPRLLKAIMAAESEFQPTALSPKGARGLLQVLPETAELMGIPRERLSEAHGNIEAGAAYLSHLFRLAWRRFGFKRENYRNAPLWLTQRVLAAYNAGPKFLWKRTDWYRQTRGYVRKVLLFYRSTVTDIRRLPRRQRLPEFPMASATGSLN